MLSTTYTASHRRTNGRSDSNSDVSVQQLTRSAPAGLISLGPLVHTNDVLTHVRNNEAVPVVLFVAEGHQYGSQRSRALPEHGLLVRLRPPSPFLPRARCTLQPQHRSYEDVIVRAPDEAQIRLENVRRH